MAMVVWASSVAATVLAAAGVLKLMWPTETGAMLSTLGLGGDGSARVLGTLELGLGIAVLSGLGPVAAGAAALAYLGFAVVLVVARRRDPDLDCGCVGPGSGPPRARHVALNGIAAAACATAAGVGAPGLTTAGHSPAGTLMLVIATAAGAAVVILGMRGFRASRHAAR